MLAEMAGIRSCHIRIRFLLETIRLLLRVGIKVADEWQISLDYVRGSNIYARGYLDLRAWSLKLRA